MAARPALSSSSSTSLGTKISALPKSFSQKSFSFSQTSSKPRVHQLRINANLGDGEIKAKKKRKFVTKEEEPEQFWQTAGEREGENPMKTPIPYIIIFGMSTPFVILAVAFANGWIKVPVR